MLHFLDVDVLHPLPTAYSVPGNISSPLSISAASWDSSRYQLCTSAQTQPSEYGYSFKFCLRSNPSPPPPPLFLAKFPSSLKQLINKTQNKEWAPEAPNSTLYLNEESILVLLASRISLRARHFLDTTI